MITIPKTKTRVAVISLLCAIILLFLVWQFGLKSGNNRAQPKVSPIVEAVYALGTVKSENVYNLRISVNSVIKQFYVTEGQLVKRNDPLVKTDSGLVLQAPFGGTITKKFLETGEIVMPGMTVLTMMDLEKTFVLVSLDQQSALRVKKGQNAELSFENIRNQKLRGTVDRIYPSNSQFLAKIIVSNMPKEALPEMTSDVAIEVARRDNALLLPMSAIKSGSVTIIRNGSTQSVQVRLGAVNGEWGEILDNTVLPTDKIVLPEKNK